MIQVQSSCLAGRQAKFKDQNLINPQHTTHNLQLGSGFSLLELLVVISIIAILVTIGFSSFGTAQMKARDSKRKNDMKEVQNGLEQFYSVCGYQYPTAAANAFFGSVICTTPGVTIAILPTIPTDPRNITPYYCSGACTGSAYTICAGLEAENPTTFCLTNKQ